MTHKLTTSSILLGTASILSVNDFNSNSNKTKNKTFNFNNLTHTIETLINDRKSIITISHMSKILCDALGSTRERMISKLPDKQQLLLWSLAVIQAKRHQETKSKKRLYNGKKKSSNSILTVGLFRNYYNFLRSKLNDILPPISKDEFNMMISNLEGMGMLMIGKNSSSYKQSRKMNYGHSYEKKSINLSVSDLWHGLCAAKKEFYTNDLIDRVKAIKWINISLLK